MYVALWCSMTSQPKRALASLHLKICNNTIIFDANNWSKYEEKDKQIGKSNQNYCKESTGIAEVLNPIFLFSDKAFMFIPIFVFLEWKVEQILKAFINIMINNRNPEESEN